MAIDTEIEETAWAKVSDVGAVLRACGAASSWATDAWVWLEREPVGLLSEAERAEGLQLRRLTADDLNTLDWASWPVGRAFDASREVRWQRMGEQVHVVWCSTLAAPGGFGFVPQPHGGVSQTDRPYVMWGRRVSQADLHVLGLATSEDEAAKQSVFMEVQIPRVLRYPIAGPQPFAQMVMREFFTSNGELTYARLCGLVGWDGKTNQTAVNPKNTQPGVAVPMPVVEVNE